MNEQLRRLLDGNIKKVLIDAKQVSELKHPGLVGKLRELFLHDLLMPLLNSKYLAGGGKITDFQGRLSNEMDLCVYSTSLLPPFFFSQREKVGVYPIESVLAGFEVKSMLTAREIRDAYNKFSFLDKELIFSPGLYDECHRPAAHYFSKPEYSIFAYDVDRKNYKVTTILDMYKKVDPEWEENPLISSICVPGKGCLVHTVKGWLHMGYDTKSKLNEEVIFYLSSIVQSFPLKEDSRGAPRIGYYLTNPSLTDRIEGGVPVGNPWMPYEWIISNQTSRNPL